MNTSKKTSKDILVDWDDVYHIYRLLYGRPFLAIYSIPRIQVSKKGKYITKLTEELYYYFKCNYHNEYSFVPDFIKQSTHMEHARYPTIYKLISDSRCVRYEDCLVYMTIYYDNTYYKLPYYSVDDIIDIDVLRLFRVADSFFIHKIQSITSTMALTLLPKKQ